MEKDFGSFISYFSGDEGQSVYRVEYDDAKAHRLRAFEAEGMPDDAARLAAESEARTFAILATFHRWNGGTGSR